VQITEQHSIILQLEHYCLESEWVQPLYKLYEDTWHYYITWWYVIVPLNQWLRHTKCIGCIAPPVRKIYNIFSHDFSVIYM